MGFACADRVGWREVGRFAAHIMAVVHT